MNSPRRTTAMIGAAAACAPLALVEAPLAMQVAAGLIGALCMVAGNHLDQRAERVNPPPQCGVLTSQDGAWQRYALGVVAAGEMPDPGPPPDGDHDVIMAWGSTRPVRYIRRDT